MKDEDLITTAEMPVPPRPRTTASAIEVREALKRGANVYAVRRDNLSDRRFPVSKARLRYGRPEVLNKYNRWQGLGGNYMAVIQETLQSTAPTETETGQ